MYNPHAEILERFERVETLINHLISTSSPANNVPANAQPPATRQLAADHLGVSLPTLDKLINSGQLISFNIGRQVRIRWPIILPKIRSKN